jgi:hypothetical protein
MTRALFEKLFMNLCHLNAESFENLKVLIQKLY